MENPLHKMSLNGIWNMKGHGFDTDGTIPGSVLSFLLDRKLIGDPFFRTNEKECLKILDDEYVFTRTFDYKGTSDAVELVMEGVDTLSTVFLNGKEIGKTENMFRTYRFDVTDALKAEGNILELRFPSYLRIISAYQKEKPLFNGCGSVIRGFPYIRKAHYMSGWDWGPMLPDAGIWKDIYLEDVSVPRITNIHVAQRHENGHVYLTPTVKTSLPGEVKITITSPSGEENTLEPNAEHEVKNPLLWWPNGYGKQPLYTVKVSVSVNGKVTDSKTKRIGLRTLVVSRDKDEWGEEFAFMINGVRIFAMGADYIPEDNILSRCSREKTKALLEKGLFAHYNCIRVWGGGYYPEDYFFDLCDEMGLIVFMDLMFACAGYDYTDKFHENTGLEIRENIQRIRDHACLGVIAGNNEIEDETWWQGKEICDGYLEFFEKFIPSILKEECPEISFIPSSPTSGGGFDKPQDENRGDCHYWNVWCAVYLSEDYKKHYFRFLSEFGFQSFPSVKTMETVTLPEDRKVHSRVMEMHQRSPLCNPKLNDHVSLYYPCPRNFDDFVYLTQVTQAESIRVAVDHLRRNRGRCMGTLYWQLNDVWPGASWSSVDSEGRLKALHYAARRFYEPVHVSCKETGEFTDRVDLFMDPLKPVETKAEFHVNNETMNDVSGTLRYHLSDSDGKVLESGEIPLTAKALSDTSVPEIDFHRTDVDENHLVYEFLVNGEVVSSGSALFTRPKYYHFRNPELTVKTDGKCITVKSGAYASYVRIENADDDLILSDNWFDMEKGEKTVRILSGKPEGLKVTSVYDILY